MRYFCTLFDKNYLYQALALYKSLESNCRDFTLYALCMDEVSFDLLSKICVDKLVPISLLSIETDENRHIKQRINRAQYFAVWQPLICIYILDYYDVELITYIDADIMFFNDPELLFEELNGYSASVVPHNYTPGFDNAAIAGKYCVQFNAFRNTSESREVLRYWKQCCFRYSKWMPYNYPGQISLDYWPIKFKNVKIIQHLGAGVAPWNIGQYEVTKHDSRVMVNGSPLVFYHFHQYAWRGDAQPFYSDYPLQASAIELIYQPYTSLLADIEQLVHAFDNSFNYRKEFRAQDVSEKLFSFIKDTVCRCFRKRLKQNLQHLA